MSDGSQPIGRGLQRRPKRRRLRRVMVGKRAVFTTGLAPSFWNDIYHMAMTARLPVFTLAIAAAFVLTNAVFAALYWIVPNCIANSGASFENLFYFSVETITTVGYGELFPQTRYAHVIVGTEVFTGLFFTATMLGLIFARMSRPRARLLFAKNLAIGPYEGRQTLSVRVANARLNVISSATARMWVLLTRTTAEGVTFRRFEEMRLVRSENPTFALSWTILHQIDEASPLHGKTPDAILAEDALFVLNIIGHDETQAQTVQSRESYVASDLHWQHRYVDVLSRLEDGTTILDYENFHDVEPITAAKPGAA